MGAMQQRGKQTGIGALRLSREREARERRCVPPSKRQPTKAKKGAGAPRTRSKGKPLWEVILFSGTTGASTALVHSRPVPCDQAPMKGLQGKERRAFFAWWFAFRQETHTFPNPASLHFWKTVTPCLLLVCSPTPYVVFERGRGTSRGGIAPLLVEERTRWLQTDFPSVGRSVVSARGGGITHSSTAAPAAGSVAILRYGRVLRRGIRPGLGVSSRPTVTQWGIDQRLLLAYGKYPHLTAEPECKSWRFHPFVSARGWPPYSQGDL